MIREDITVDQFIDVLLGNRKYVPCLYVYNKSTLRASHAVDGISMEEMDRLANEPRSVVISCNLNLNLDYLVERIWEELKLLRIYTKKRGEHPDLTDPIIVRRGATIEHVVRTSPLTAVPWRAPCAGRQVCLVRIVYSPQRYGVWQIEQVRTPVLPRFPLAQKVGLNHLVANDDVVTIFTRRSRH